MKEENLLAPWLGLQSYKEGQQLYGRDADIQALSQNVLAVKEMLLFGRSGIGKTSIVNAGLIPYARLHNFVPIPIRLNHDNHAKTSYLNQIREAIVSHGIVIQALSSANSESEVIWEFFHRNEFYQPNKGRAKLLLIFDQFEEIFTLQSNAKERRKFFVEMADFFNDIMPHKIYEAQHESSQNFDTGTCRETTIYEIENDGLSHLEIDFNLPYNRNDFTQKNEIHVLFTIREDFLSDFEYYTATIPLLRQHRYGLRPLNEEQAAEIILRPKPGLIEKSVAKLIIEKITQRSDFDLDGLPEIEVDAAVLSLYMCRLYQRIPTHDRISAEDVQQLSSNIFKDYYLESIQGISTSTVTFLEKTLLTKNGRRNNVSRSELFENDVTRTELHALVNEKKILREFAYGGDIRIEYVHDILCTVIHEIQKERDEKILLANAIKNRNRTKRLSMTSIVLLVIFPFVYGIFQMFFSSKEVNVQLKEELTIDNDAYWKAKVEIMRGNHTLALDTLDKVNTFAAFHISTREGNKELQCKITPIIGNIRAVVQNLNLTDSTFYEIPISKKSNSAFIKGNVRVASGSRQPVIGAIVIWGSQVVKTDALGRFSFDKPADYGIVHSYEPTLKIIKEGYQVLEEKIHKTSKEFYMLKLNNPCDFYRKCELFEKEYGNAEEKDSILGTLVFNGVVAKNALEMKVYRTGHDGKFIRGFYYYKHKLKDYKDKHQMYILMEGKLNDDGTYLITSMDDAWNKRTIHGSLKTDKHVSGQIYSNNQIFSFELIPK